jgi:CRP-like cAMP-binding protein
VNDKNTATRGVSVHPVSHHDLKESNTLKKEIAALRLKKNIRQTLENISKDGKTTDAARNLKKVEDIQKNHQKHRNSALKKVEKHHTNRRSSLQLRVQARKKVKHSNALLKSDCFSTLDPNSMSTIIDEMEFIPIRDNNFEMCRQGDDADIFYIIVSGACQVTIDGKPIALLGEMDIFGESALFTDGQGRSRRGATVTTINDESEDVQVLALSREKFNKLIASGDLNEDCVNKLKIVAEKRRKENKNAGVDTERPKTDRSSEIGEVKLKKQMGEKKTEACVETVGNSGSVAVPDHASAIETVRLLLKKKVRSLNKFSVIFKKMDKDGKGTLSRKEFKRLIQLTVKSNKELVDGLDVYFEALWVEVCTKKGGGGEVEVGLETVASWLF